MKEEEEPEPIRDTSLTLLFKGFIHTSIWTEEN